jgi:hypothetical protein
MKHALRKWGRVHHEPLHWLHANDAVFESIKVDVFPTEADFMLPICMRITVLVHCPATEAMLVHTLYQR